MSFTPNRENMGGGGGKKDTPTQKRIKTSFTSSGSCLLLDQLEQALS